MPNLNYVHTITLYNCFKAVDHPSKKEVWYRHVLTDCFFKSKIHTSLDGKQAVQSNTYVTRIPEHEKYVPYHKWILLEEEERGSSFTVSLGDIVVCGDCTEEITGELKQTATQVMNRYKPEAFRVSAVSVNTSFLEGKHYRLGG